MSQNREGFIHESKYISKPNVPEIYKLIESKSPTDKIVQEIYTEFYNGNSSSERLFLGFRELLDRGNEGIVALSFLGRGTDDLAHLALKLSENTAMDQYQLEKVLGIKRWDMLTSSEQMFRDEDLRKELVEYAEKKGYIPRGLSFEDLYVPMMVAEQLGLHSHLGEAIDEDILTTSATFAVREPAYLEMLGAKEILRLREKQNTNMLLLGSYGKYSSREFDSFAHKINPDIKTFTIDIKKASLDRIKNDTENPGEKLIVQADALQLPFKDESMDQMYTNFLLRFPFSDGREVGHTLKAFFEEVYRVLKPGGSLVLVEGAFGKYKENADVKGSKKEIRSAALQTNFTASSELPHIMSYILRAEVGTSEISENGFPHYEGKLLDVSSIDKTINLRLIKPT